MDTSEAPVGKADRDVIVAAATDYIESWLDGDAERMARCLHPELVKREVHYDDTFAVETLTLQRRPDREPAPEEGASGDEIGARTKPFKPSAVTTDGGTSRWSTSRPTRLQNTYLLWGTDLTGLR